MINSVCSDVFESRQKSFVGLKRKRWSFDRSHFSDVSRFKSKWQTSNSQYLLPKLRNAFLEADRLYNSWQLRDWDGIVKIHCSPHGWVWFSAHSARGREPGCGVEAPEELARCPGEYVRRCGVSPWSLRFIGAGPCERGGSRAVRIGGIRPGRPGDPSTPRPPSICPH